jgi:hypothetical protein
MPHTKSTPTKTPATTSTQKAGPIQLFCDYYPAPIRSQLEEAYATKSPPAPTTEIKTEDLTSYKDCWFIDMLPTNVRKQIFRSLFAGGELQMGYTDHTMTAVALKDESRVLSILRVNRLCYEDASKMWRSWVTIKVLPSMLPVLRSPTYTSQRSQICRLRINRWELKKIAEYYRGNWNAHWPKLLVLEFENKPKNTIVDLDHIIDSRYKPEQLVAIPRAPGARGFLRSEIVRDAFKEFDFVKGLELNIPEVRQVFDGPTNKRKRAGTTVTNAPRMRLAVPMQVYGGEYLAEWPILESEGFKYRMVDGLEDPGEAEYWLPAVSDERPLGNSNSILTI